MIDSWAYATIAGFGLMLVTIATRGSFFMLKPSIELSPRLERALRYAPACAIAAVVAPGILTRDRELYLAAGNHKIWAVLAASAVCLKYRNMVAMMLVGMAVFTALRLLG